MNIDRWFWKPVFCFTFTHRFHKQRNKPNWSALKLNREIFRVGISNESISNNLDKIEYVSMEKCSIKIVPDFWENLYVQYTEVSKRYHQIGAYTRGISRTNKRYLFMSHYCHVKLRPFQTSLISASQMFLFPLNILTCFLLIW